MNAFQKRLEQLKSIAECRPQSVAIIEQTADGCLFNGELIPADLIERELATRGVKVVIIDDI